MTLTELGAPRPGSKPTKTKALAAQPDSRLETLTTRVLELESILAQQELETAANVAPRRIKRLEADVGTYKAAREKTEFVVTDLRASLDLSAVAADAMRESPEYRLGVILLAAGTSWSQFVRLPTALREWVRANRRHSEGVAARFVPTGPAAEYTAAVDRALAFAGQHGIAAAERWTIDQRYRAPVLARVLAELAGLALPTDAPEAARLAAAAFEAEPGEGYLKRLALMLAESGAIAEAAPLLRSAIGKGVVFNRTEDDRAHEVFALEEVATNGLSLLPKKRARQRSGRRVLLIAPQAFPFHWTSASIRAHATALSLVEAGRTVDVITMPGYPNIGRRQPIDLDATRTIEGITYHILPAASVRPGFGEDHVAEAAAMLISRIKSFGASVVMAPSGLTYSYPAAVAARTAGAALVLDCSTVSPDVEACQTERDRIVSRVEDDVLRLAQHVIARTTAIEARLARSGPQLNVTFVPDAMHNATAVAVIQPRPATGSFCFGYVGDNATDVDIECLGTVLERLVADGIDARLVIRSVGGRMQAIGQKLDLLGFGHRVTIIEKSPNGRRAELAYDELDAVVIPYVLTNQRSSSPFQILLALRHAKCVVALGAGSHREMFGDALIYGDDLDAVTASLRELATDADERARQEARAGAWRDRHGSGNAVAGALETI